MSTKTLFQSELVKCGAVDVLVKSEVQDSKFIDKSTGKYPRNVLLVLNGEDRRLTLENDECCDAMSGLTGKRVTIEAFGSREEATISVTQNGDAPQKRQPSNQQRESNHDSNGPRRITEEDRLSLLKAAWLKAHKTGNLLTLCLVEAYEVARAVSDRTNGDVSFSVSDIEKIGVTIFIESKAYVDISNLPKDLPPMKADRQPVQPPATYPDRQPVQRPAPAQQKPVSRPPAPVPDEIEEDDVPF